MENGKRRDVNLLMDISWAGGLVSESGIFIIFMIP
jgi:hypothetical protein